VAGDGIGVVEGPGRRVNDDSGQSYLIAFVARHAEMDGIGNRVAEIEQIERALVGDNGCLLTGGKPSGNYLFVGRGWVVADPVHARGNAEESAGAHVVRQQVAAEPAHASLGRREIAVLLRGNLEQARIVRSLACYVMHIVNSTDWFHDV